MQVETGMGFEPALYRRGLMGGIVIHDQMEVEIGRGLMIDQLEKTQELSMPMARHASPDNSAVQHVQRCKQGGGAVSLVVMGHGAGAPLFMGNPGWVRSRSWIWLFSSTQRTKALSGGLR